MFWLQRASKCIQPIIRPSMISKPWSEVTLCDFPASVSFFNNPSHHFHTSSVGLKEINYAEFAQMKHGGMMIIDVRARNEIRASGSIPGSLNIPFDKVDAALQKSPQEFKKVFGLNKPKENSPIMFLCQRGRRSKAAMDAARAMGYRKAMSFRGGWENYRHKAK